MSKQQTAVEWLQEQLRKGVNYNPLDKNSYLDNVEKLFQQAKEMEDQQRGYSEEDLKQAFITGALTDLFNTWGISDENMAKEKFKEYYNKTFGGGEDK